MDSLPDPAKVDLTLLWGKIQTHGDKIRNLKNAKTTTEDIDAEVQVLLRLKEAYEKQSGSDWDPKKQPGAAASVPGPVGKDAVDALWEKVKTQGDSVRKLKNDKAPKDEVTTAVQVLLSLKNEYKQVTGLDWDPNSKPEEPSSSSPSAGGGGDALAAWEKTQVQGEKVRKLKAGKASKNEVLAAVQML